MPATGIELRRSLRRLRWEPAQVEAHQLELLRATLAHATASVRLYRARYPHGLALRSLGDLRDLPVLERDEVATAPVDDRRGTPLTDRTLSKRTSGTTGEYLTVELGARAAWWQGILELRRNWTRGLQPWDRTAAIRVDPDRRSRRGLLGTLARRATVIDAAEPPAAIARVLGALDPVAVSGFGHLLIDVGRALDRSLRPRVVGTGGQVLSEMDRASIADAFGTLPLDLYGSVEVGSIAWQCGAADLYHVDHDSVIVEVVDSEGDPVPVGVAGSVVVTTLQNPHMPFLRYRLGDWASVAIRPCRCGWNGPAIQAIEGREMDRFVDEHGLAIASSRLFLSAQLADVVQWIGRYRVRQDRQAAVTVEVVPVGGASLPDQVVTRIIDGYRSVLGRSAPVTVEVVRDIPLEPSGKLRQFVSNAVPGPPHDAVGDAPAHG